MDSATHIDPYVNSLQNQASTSKFPGSPHQPLNQALGQAASRAFQSTFHQASPVHSPVLQSELQLANIPQTHAAPNGHSPLRFSMPLPNGDLDPTSTAVKRKQDSANIMGEGSAKRRREGEDTGDDHDGPGAKQYVPCDYKRHHLNLTSPSWTDEEKGRLFTWLMAPNQDEHWNSLRAAKNSALRECAAEVFGNKKSYQALKGCFERNFNVFRQIYAFQTFSAQLGNIVAQTDGDRIREYERRLLDARKSGCDVGNVNARTIDQWHRSGWYPLFLNRWEGDPAIHARVVPRNPNRSRSGGEGGEGGDVEDASSSFDPLVSMAPGSFHDRAPSLVTQFQINPNSPPPPMNFEAPPPPNPEPLQSSKSSSGQLPSYLTLPESMTNACLQLLQTHCHQSAQKLEFLRKREEREERESRERREFDRARHEREAAEWELKKQSADTTTKSRLATDILANPAIDAATRGLAGDYLKRLFS